MVIATYIWIKNDPERVFLIEDVYTKYFPKIRFQTTSNFNIWLKMTHQNPVWCHAKSCEIYTYGLQHLNFGLKWSPDDPLDDQRCFQKKFGEIRVLITFNFENRPKLPVKSRYDVILSLVKSILMVPETIRLKIFPREESPLDYQRCSRKLIRIWRASRSENGWIEWPV